MNPITRRLILASAGVGAALVGGAVAWRRFTPPPMSAVAQAFWTHDFRDPNGRTARPRALARQTLLVNFWATWCPCIKELPEINQFYGEAKRQGWQVLGVAVDQPGPVRAFLQKQPLAFPIAMAGDGGLALVEQLGNTDGGLPFLHRFRRHRRNQLAAHGCHAPSGTAQAGRVLILRSSGANFGPDQGNLPDLTSKSCRKRVKFAFSFLAGAALLRWTRLIDASSRPARPLTSICSAPAGPGSMATRPWRRSTQNLRRWRLMPAPSCGPSRATTGAPWWTASRLPGRTGRLHPHQPGGLHPTSVAIRDALAGVSIPLHRGSPLQHPPPRSLPPPQLPGQAGGRRDLRPRRQRLPPGAAARPLACPRRPESQDNNKPLEPFPWTCASSRP